MSHGENVTDETFPYCTFQFCFGSLIFVSMFAMKMLAKAIYQVPRLARFHENPQALETESSVIWNDRTLIPTR